MAFTKDNLTPLGGGSRRGKAPQMWIYKTDDAHASIDSAGYFDNGTTTNTGMRDMMNIGDVIFVVVVTNLGASNEAVATYGTHIVNANASGVIDCSDVTVHVVTDTD